MSSDLSQFFGELNGTVVDVKQDQYYQNTHELPDAYIGRNRFLMSTLDYLITKEGRDFLTNVILPFEHTDNTNVAWEVFHFDRSLADIEPEQGVPRYVTMKQDIKKDRLVRRGLAFMIEHGFYTTDIGRRHYMMNIQQIVDAVAETTALQALHSMIEVTDFYSVAPSDLEGRKNFLVEQLRRFAVIQRGNHGMHILDSDLKDAMLRYNVRPDSYIMPPRSTSYINMRDPYMTEYSRGGRGVKALEGPDQQLTFRGTRVYEARYFETDYVSEPYDPLSQIITYAEYYHCSSGGVGRPSCYVYDFTRDGFTDLNMPVAPALLGLARDDGAIRFVRESVQLMDDLQTQASWAAAAAAAGGALTQGDVQGKLNADRGVVEAAAAPGNLNQRIATAAAALGAGAGAWVADTQAIIADALDDYVALRVARTADDIAGDERKAILQRDGVFRMRDLSELDGMQFMRMKDVTDAATFGSNFLSKYDSVHHDAVIEHLAGLPSGSIVRAKYVKDFIKAL